MIQNLTRFWSLSLFASGIFLSACTFKRAELGTAGNPVKLFFVPSVDAKVIEDNSRIFRDFLEAKTGLKFQVAIPQSYVAVVEAFGTKRADVAAFTSYGYILANERYGAEARLIVLRHGSSDYRSQFVVRSDSGIKSLADLAGKRIAFVDPSSASGYLLPLRTLRERKIEVGNTVFAGKHDNVISMVYNRQVDAGATFWSPEDAEGPQDARRLVRTQFPDVMDKVKILELTEPIPNDPIVFRKDMPEEMKEKITQAFLDFVVTESGREAFKKIYGVDGLRRTKDSEYNKVREMLHTVGQKASDLVK
jgi:phosphonate transport system substrate-binding protein